MKAGRFPGFSNSIRKQAGIIVNSLELKKILEEADMILVGIGEDFEEKRYLQERKEYCDCCGKIAQAHVEWVMPYVNRLFLKEDDKLRSAYQELAKLLEGRNYFDAFVIGAKCDGVYAAFASANVVAAPSISISSHSATVTSASGVTFYYTLDGTDPRYSSSSMTYSSAVTTVSGQTIKVAGKKDGRWSAVSEKTDA